MLLTDIENECFLFLFSQFVAANAKPVGVQVRSSLEDESGSPGVSDHSFEPINKKVSFTNIYVLNLVPLLLSATKSQGSVLFM